MENKNNRILLFDFDGVIVDSFDISYNVTKVVTLGSISEDEYRSFFDGNIYDNIGVELETDEDSLFFDIYAPLLMRKKPILGIVDVIKELYKNYRLAIISSSTSKPIKDFLNKHGLLSYFEKVYGADVNKSKIKKIEMAFGEFNANTDDCLFITDTLGDMLEAQKAGIKSFGVSWGFQKKESLIKGNPIAVADSPKELLLFLNKLTSA